MKVLTIYNSLKQSVHKLYTKLNLKKHENTKGRKLSLSIKDTITLGLYKHEMGTPTKRKVYEDFGLEDTCTYKTFVVNLNRCALLVLLILVHLMRMNRKNASVVKYTDSTDIPVCLNKNAKRHKTMYGLSEWGKTGKGWFYGLKLHITVDYERSILSISLTPGNVDDRDAFKKMNKDLTGIFMTDSGYIGEDFAKDFHIPDVRMVIAKPRANMKKVATEEQNEWYDGRMRIELDFRSLKLFHGLVTSLPRSRNGYVANYVYSIAAHMLS